MSTPKTPLPTITVPIVFTLDHAPGWKSGYLHMKMGGGEVSHNGKRLGYFASDAFGGHPVVEIDSADSSYILSAKGAEIFGAVLAAVEQAKKGWPGAGFDPVGDNETEGAKRQRKGKAAP